MPEDLEVVVEPYEDEPTERLRHWRDVLVRHDRIREHLGDVDPAALRVLGPVPLGRKHDESSPFVATLFDPGQNRSVEVTGRLDGDDVEVTSSAFRPNPTGDELRAALEVLRDDRGFADLRDRDDVVVYQPMPPLADVERDDGTTVWRIALGVYDPRAGRPHRFVAVDLGDRLVEWDPEPFHELDGDCEDRLPVGVESLPDAGGRDSVRVRVLRGGVELWNLVVVRPRASLPTHLGKGSGVELRDVTYRGRLVLWQAHVPILNVLYDDGTSYRDWQNQETPFLANGVDPVGPGWRVCTSPPATILEAGTDAGNFQGVALWYEDGELRIVSELQAAWYRYISDWRLRDDGTVKPRFGFAGTRNYRTCLRHQHHVYWRLDFDIEGAGNDVVEERGLIFPGVPPWKRLVRETKRKRSLFAARWRVRDAQSRRGYSITPGSADSTSDAYGVADLWFLRWRYDELDDGVGIVVGSPAETQCRLDQYLTAESIDSKDVVVWYAGHFSHDEEHPSPHHGHIIGPELRPINW
ncbi:hypothetical protein ACGFIF_41825 [Kribbella sp. NPDC049174]|uniref:hypothetical protein n=1 Tax=Kribbella sp. NPDC049174 TaxID=3364112 RepID=UPI00371941DA